MFCGGKQPSCHYANGVLVIAANEATTCDVVTSNQCAAHAVVVLNVLVLTKSRFTKGIMITNTMTKFVILLRFNLAFDLLVK